MFHSYVTRERRNYLEVLFDFKSARPPLGSLLRMIPPLQPRQFSIASSQRAHPGQLQLCVAVVAYELPCVGDRGCSRGVCSAMGAVVECSGRKVG